MSGSFWSFVFKVSFEEHVVENGVWWVFIVFLGSSLDEEGHFRSGRTDREAFDETQLSEMGK